MRIGYLSLPGQGATDACLTRVVAILAGRGVPLAGTVQTNPGRAGRQVCDMDVRVLPDGPVYRISQDLGADLILVTGGTGPAPRDRTPEGIAAVIDFDLPGFGEAMRAASLAEVPTAILSRQGAGVRGRCVIVSLPGNPRAIGTCLQAVLAAVPCALDLIGAARIETGPDRIRAFRPG